MKAFFTSHYFPVLSNISGTGIAAWCSDILPILSVVSILSGIILGVLSYRLKLKQSRQNEKYNQS